MSKAEYILIRLVKFCNMRQENIENISTDQFTRGENAIEK